MGVPAEYADLLPANRVPPEYADLGGAPREGHGPWDAVVAGYQGAGTGLLVRGKLPNVVLDPQHAKWYENALETLSGIVSDLPQSIAGAIAGSAAGTAVAPGIGTTVGGGAGALAVPAAIRESLVHAYQNGEVSSSSDFLDRVGIAIRGLSEPDVLKAAGKAAVVGGLTGMAGKFAAPLGNAAKLGAEVGTLTVAPAALEGRLPEPWEIANAAVTLVGMKVATKAAGKIADIYAKTGRAPEDVVADAKSDQTIVDDLKSDLPVPRAYQPLAQEEMLKSAMPEPAKLQEIIANPRGRITDEKEPNHINYDFVEAPEDVIALRARMSEVLKSEIEAIRGKESWEQTQAKAQDVITNRLAGMPEDQQARLSRMTFSDLAAQSLAVEAMAQKAAFDARQAAMRIATKGDAATAEDFQAQVKAIETAALLHAIDQGNGAEIARALNSRKAASQRAALAQGMAELVAKYGEDPHKLARMILGLHDTAQLTKFASEASKATTWMKIVEAWKAGILSGPLTHMANILGNTTFAAFRLPIDLTAAAISAVTGGERVSFVEPFARMWGNLQGAKDALVFAGEALKAAYGEGGWTGVMKEAAEGRDYGKSEQYRKAIEGTKGTIIRLPFRTLSLEDDFFKVVASQGERYALATRQATKEGYNLLSREFRERVTDLVQNDADIADKGDAAALRFTFNTPLGEKGQAVQNLVRKAHLELLVPFIRTPGNIFKEMIRLTPLAPVIKEWRDAYSAGGAERAKAVAELAMGTAISAVVVSYAKDGSITGQGPADQNKRRTWLAAGNQPYSIRIGDKWYSYQRLQPLGTLMGMAADLSEVWENVEEDEGNKAATMLSVAFANAVTQQTFLSGITHIVQVLADPQRYGPQFVEQYAGSVVPALVAQSTQMIDPLQRETHGIIEAVQARIPGLRENLQPRINPLTGEPLDAKDRLAGVAPINVRDISQDPVLQEAARLGVGLPKTPKNLQMPSPLDKSIGKLELTPEQQTLFASTTGELAHQILSQIVGSEAWNNAKPAIQRQIYAKVFAQARKVGMAKAVPGEERAAMAQEMADKLREKLSD
jgi:hypothetical protein